MEVVAIIGERLYHAAGSDCHRRLEAQGDAVLVLTAAQANEVGMEPCGVCMSGRDFERPIPQTG